MQVRMRSSDSKNLKSWGQTFVLKREAAKYPLQSPEVLDSCRYFVLLRGRMPQAGCNRHLPGYRTGKASGENDEAWGFFVCLVGFFLVNSLETKRSTRAAGWERGWSCLVRGGVGELGTWYPGS